MKPIQKRLITLILLLSTTLCTSQGTKEQNILETIFNNYFLIKDALVKSDAKTAAVKAVDFNLSVSNLNMELLSTAEHAVYIKVMNDLANGSKSISATTNIKNQRELFKQFSADIYSLMKVTSHDKPFYYNHCPMVDASWLSTEKGIKNPYYGSQMLTCGKTIEILK